MLALSCAPRVVPAATHCPLGSLSTSLPPPSLLEGQAGWSPPLRATRWPPSPLTPLPSLLDGAGRLAPLRHDCPRVLLLGCCLFFNQLFFILGIALSGVVVATCMQPAIPVFTAVLALMLGTEAGSLRKFMGIAMAVGGSVCMVRGLGRGRGVVGL